MTYLPGSLYTFQSVTSTPTPISISNRIIYVCLGTSTLNFKLPPSAIAGFSFKIIGRTCNWSILQNAMQNITNGTLATNSGITGALSSSSVTDKVEVTCLTATTGWDVTESFGNLITI